MEELSSASFLIENLFAQQIKATRLVMPKRKLISLRLNRATC
jgi:hypothetical protein